MPVSNVIFDGDASGAVAAAKETQAAIDSVHGKSVSIDVNVRNGGASDAILAAIGEHGNAAADAHDRLSRAEGRSSASARDNANAHARASDGLREHSTAAERHMRLVDEMRGGNDRATDSVNESAASHGRASEALDRHTESAKNFDDMWNRTQGKAFPGFAAPSGPAVQGRAPSTVPSLPSTAPSPAVERSWDMPGRAAQVEALQAATGRLSLAQTRAAATSSDFHRSFQQAYESAPAGVDAMEHASRATSGLRQEMNVAQGAFRAADRDVKDLRSSFDDAGRFADVATSGIRMSGNAMGNAGIAAGVLVLGMGAVAAGAGVLGAGAAFESLRTAPGMANAAKQAMGEFEKGVKNSGEASREAALSAMPALKSAIHGLGDEFGRVGAQNMKGTIDGVRQLVDSASNNLDRLAPAIAPAEKAMVSLGKAALNSLGDSAGVIGSFSNAVTAASPGIQSALTGTIALAGQLGNGVAGLFQAYGGDIPKIMAQSEAFAKPQMGFWDTVLGAQRDPKTGAVTSVWGGPTGSDSFLGTTRSDSGFVSGIFDYSAAGDANRAASRAKQTGEYGPGQTPAFYGTGTRVEPKDLYPISPDSDPSRSSVPSVQRAVSEAAGVAPPSLPRGVTAPQPSPASAPSLLQSLPRSVGESGGLQGTASQLQQLNQEMAKTTNMSPLMQQSMSSVGQAAQQSMQQAGSAAQSAAPQFQSGLGQLQQHAQQLPPQIGSTMSMLGPALQQPLQQAMPQAAQAIQPQPMVDAMGGAMTKMVRQTQPQAESGGSDIGASVPSGFGQGVQKDIDKVVTIVEHLITKVIRAGAEGLQTASPSRVFDTFGRSIPDGLAQGIEAQAPSAVQATSNLIGQMTTGASGQLGSQQQALQNQLAQQQQQLQSQQQQAQAQQAQAQQQIYQQPPGFGGSPFTNQSAAMQKVQQQQEEEIKRAMQTGDTSRLSPEMQQKFEQAKQAAGLHTYDSGFAANAARYDLLTGKRGFTDETAERIQRRETEHDRIAGLHKESRDNLHDYAKNLARNPSDAAMKALKEQGDMAGQAYGNGTADGIKRSQGKVGAAARDMVDAAGDETKKKAGIASPSKLFAGYGGDVASGFATGMSSAITGASNTIGGVASDRGLQVGYRWATSMATGIQSVFKSSDFQANAVPQIQNDQAKSVLGQLGLLGAAGSGASIYKTPMVAFGGSGSATPVVQSHLYLTVNLDGQPFKQMTAQALDGFADQIATSVANQVG